MSKDVEGNHLSQGRNQILSLYLEIVFQMKNKNTVEIENFMVMISKHLLVEGRKMQPGSVLI